MNGRLAARVGDGLALLAVAAFALAAVSYLLYQGYVDHGEAVMSAMAWRMLHGAKVYLPFDDPDQITNLYGPLTFLWHSWPLALFGGGVSASKAAATVAALLLPPAIWLIVRKDPAITGWVMALTTGLLIIHLAFPVVIRPDSLLTLMVATATLLAARDTEGMGRTILIGVAIGAGIGIKIHGALYFAPLAIYHFWGHWRRIPVMGVASVAVALAPFALPMFPLKEYLAWFGPMAGKENDWPYLLAMAELLALYATPLLVWALGGRRALAATTLRERLYAGTYAAAMVLVLYPATKTGGGGHYLMPFLPVAADQLRRAFAAGGSTARQRAGLMVAVLVALVTDWQCERRFFKKLEWEKSRAVVAEIEKIMDDYPGETVQMGIGRTPTDTGDQLSIHYYTWRNLPVYRGNPFTIDAAIVMELHKLGMPFPAEAVHRFERCDTRIWLIPKDGEPFRLWGYYYQEAFPEEVRTAFQGHYVKAESRTFFDVWKCRDR